MKRVITHRMLGYYLRLNMSPIPKRHHINNFKNKTLMLSIYRTGFGLLVFWSISVPCQSEQDQPTVDHL